MGAMQFSQFGTGKDLKAAFAAAREEAAYVHGHGGYTGTLAEKYEVTFIGTQPTKKDAVEYAQKLMADDDERISDKWGPAGAIRVGATNEFLFFGWASS